MLVVCCRQMGPSLHICTRRMTRIITVDMNGGSWLRLRRYVISTHIERLYVLVNPTSTCIVMSAYCVVFCKADSLRKHWLIRNKRAVGCLSKDVVKRSSFCAFHLCSFYTYPIHLSARIQHFSIYSILSVFLWVFLACVSLILPVGHQKCWPTCTGPTWDVLKGKY